MLNVREKHGYFPIFLYHYLGLLSAEIKLILTSYN